MLGQSIVGLSDDEIVDDYHLSDRDFRSRDSGSAAADGLGAGRQRSDKRDRSVFSGAPRHAMMSTLEMIRSEYGSVSPGYLDEIGFDRGWRLRFLAAVVGRGEIVKTEDLHPSRL